MAAWLPLIKASLPYVTQIVTAAIPAFTPKPGGGNPDEVVAKQIAELQTAVTHNAESLKALAQQLKDTIEAIEAGAAGLQAELTRLRRLTTAAVAVAVLCALVTIGVLVSR